MQRAMQINLANSAQATVPELISASADTLIESITRALRASNTKGSSIEDTAKASMLGDNTRRARTSKRNLGAPHGPRNRPSRARSRRRPFRNWRPLSA